MNQLFYPFSGYGLEMDAISNLMALRSFPEKQFTYTIPLVEGLYNSPVGINRLPTLFPSPEPLKKQQPFYQLQEQITNDSLPVRPNENSPQKETRAEEPLDGKSYSKYCLRFCRKLSKTVLEQIKDKKTLCNNIIDFCAEASNAVFVAYQLPKVNPTEYATLVRRFLDNNWDKFRVQMSYSYNKGICIVKYEHWASVFDRSALTKNFQEFALGMENSNSINYERIFNDEGLVNSLGRILYICSIIMVLTIVLKDENPKAKYLRTLEKADNFLTLVIKPSLFKNYNHRSGKFALECCGKCKICRSKLLSAEYAKELEKARRVKDTIKSSLDFTLSNTSKVTADQVSALYNLAVNYL